MKNNGSDRRSFRYRAKGVFLRRDFRKDPAVHQFPFRSLLRVAECDPGSRRRHRIADQEHEQAGDHPLFQMHTAQIQDRIDSNVISFKSVQMLYNIKKEEILI